MKLMPSKEFLAMGGGAAVGMIQVQVMEKYVDINYGTVPFIGDYLPAPWNKWSTIGNIIFGGVALGIAKFGKFGKKKNVRWFLGTYGVTTLIGGAVGGILTPAPPVARARAMARTVQPIVAPRGPVARPPLQAPVPMGGPTPTGISGSVIVA